MLQKTLFTLLFVIIFAHLFSQSFSGTVAYTVEMKGPIAEQIGLNEPNNKIEMHIHQGDYIVNLTGGRYPKTYLYINKMDREYSVDASQKVAFKFSAHEDINRETEKEKPVARAIDKQEEVNGYLCEVYGIKKDGATIFFFVNENFRVDTTLFDDKVQAKPNFLVPGLGGLIPLKTIKKQQGLTVTTTCKMIKEREFDPSQFTIPEDFEIRNRDYRP
jgi:hypothetical protein